MINLVYQTTTGKSVKNNFVNYLSVINVSQCTYTKTALYKANVASRVSMYCFMTPCKRKVKATRHLTCNSCSNWVDFVKSGCEKSWAEVQADSFSFECRGCTRMKELEVELEQLRLLVVAVVGREQVGCGSGSGGGTVDDKVGEDDERDARGSSPQPGRRLRGGKVTGRRETGRKETGRREIGRKETRMQMDRRKGEWGRQY